METLAILLAGEGFLNWLQTVDRAALLTVNGSDSLFLDAVVHVLTTATTWIPLYLSLFYLVVRNNNTVMRIAIIVGIGTLVDVVDGYRGGKYGFFSAHACNTFSIAIFFSWLVRSKVLTFTLVLWSLVNCWTRLYLGVHFPGDILVGLTWGFIVGTSVYFFYLRVTHNMRAEGRRHISTDYTDGGFERPSCDIPVSIFYFTLVTALLIATYQ